MFIVSNVPQTNKWREVGGGKFLYTRKSTKFAGVYTTDLYLFDKKITIDLLS